MPEDDEGERSAASDSPEAAPRRDDGLDLARAAARATSGSPAPPASRRRGSGSGGRRRGGPSGSSGPGEVRYSGAHPDARDPQGIAAEMERMTGERGWELPLRMRGVFARWEELVGEEVAAHCRPESFADGVLAVRTDSTAWATQLRLLVPQLLRRLNEELGQGTVTVVDVQGPRGPTWRKGPRSVRDGRGPRDTYG